MFGIGETELVIIIVFGFLLFGPDKLPGMGRTIGRFLRQFREASEGFTEVVQTNIVDPATEELNPTAKSAKRKPAAAQVADDDDADVDDSDLDADAVPRKRETFAERKARLQAEREAREAEEKAAQEAAAAEAAQADAEDADSDADAGAPAAPAQKPAPKPAAKPAAKPASGVSAADLYSRGSGRSSFAKQKAAAKAEAEAQQLREQKARGDLAAKVSAATGVPASLIQGATEAEMQASADAIASFAKAAKPNVPSDKGGAANQHAITPEGIEGIKDPVARVRARAQNLSLYE